MGEKVLVGISGGIDSAATMLLLRQRGFCVEAVFIDMLDCAASRAKVEALTAQMGVPLHIAAASQLFETEVVSRVLDEHRKGRTPSPCTLCNPRLKWFVMAQLADSLGIKWLATGHYVRIVEHEGYFRLKRGVDPIKDQSYYLYSLDQSILSRAITPLGEMTKLDVRAYLDGQGFKALAAGGESQGVCFAKGGYREFLTSNLDLCEGDVVDVDGAVVGSHGGIPIYTIGQKRGFDYNGTGRVEVREVDATTNRLVVGEPLMVGDLWLSGGWFRPIGKSAVTALIRGLGRNVASAVEVGYDCDQLWIHSPEEKFWAPAKGQPVVVYEDDVVVGGGILERWK